jgi:hypothetical protein
MEIGKVVSDLGFSLILIAIALAPRVSAGEEPNCC